MLLCIALPVSAQNDGDIFLGIRNTSGTAEMTIDLGSMDQFAAATSNHTTLDSASFGISSANLFTDLNTFLGTGWYGVNNNVFTIFGGFGDALDNSINTTASYANANNNPNGVAILVGSTSSVAIGNVSDQNENGLATIAGNIGGNTSQVGVTFLNNLGSGITAWISPQNSAGNLAGYQLNGPGNSGNLKNTASYNGIFVNNFETSVSNSLYLNTVFSSASTGLASANLGAFTIGNNGSLTFTPTVIGGGEGGGAYAGPWNWTAASGNWSVTNNWQSNSIATNGLSVGITGAGGMITNDTVSTIGSLTYSNGAGAYNLTGTNASQILTVTGGITNNSSATETISLGLNTTSNQTFNAASGNLSLSGGVSNAATLTMQESAGKAITVNGVVTGAGSLIQSGSGTLTLNGANSYAGGTTLNGGTVIAGNSSAFGSNGISVASNAVIAAGTAITLTNAIGVSSAATATMDNHGNNWTQNGAISGLGAISLSGAGTTTLGVSNNYAGGTTLNGGNVVAGNNNSFGSGTIKVASSSTIAAGTDLLTTTNAVSVATAQIATLNTAGKSWTQSGVVSGNGGVTITNTTGTSVLTLSASNTYTGSTLIGGGTLQVTGSLLGSGTVTVATGGTLTGTGSVGKTTIQSGATISAGTSGNVGTLSLSSLILNGGGAINWKMLDAAGVPGIGYDTLGITGTLDLSSLNAGNKFTIYLQTLSSTAVSGSAANFNANVSTNWVIASYGNLMGTFSTNLFAINASGFANGQNGSFGISTNSTGLLLSYTTAFVAGVSGEWNSASGGLSSKPLITNGSSLLFSGIGGSVTNDSVTSLVGITFATNAGAYNFSGNAITNGGSGIINNSSNSQSISNAITLGAVQTFTAGGGSLTFAGNVGLSSNTLTITGSNDTLLSGVVTGTAGITKTGTGTLILSGADSFTGGVTISSGSLLLSGGDNRLWTNSSVSIAMNSVLNLGTNSQQLSSLSGSGTVTGQSSATLILAPSNASSFAGTIAGGEAVAVTGTGTMTLSGSNTYSGGTTVNGNLIASNVSALGNTNNSLAVAGTLNLGSQTISQGQVTLAGGAISGGTLSTTNVNLQGGTISANLSGSAGVTQSLGTSILSGSNSFTGGVSVNGGTLVASNAGALAGGDVSVNAGTLNLSSVSQNVRAVTLGNGTVTGTGVLSSISFTDTSTGSSLVAESLAGTGGFTQNGVGTTTLSRSNSFTGGVAVNRGTLVASNAYALGSTNGSLNVAGGTVNLGGFSQSLGSATITSGSIGNGTLTASYGLTITGNSNSSISASLGGTGGLTKSGSGTLNLATAIPNGSVRITSGTLLSSSSVIGAVTNSSASVTISNGASWQNGGLLTVGGSSNATATLSIAAGGSLVATNGLTIARDGGSKGTVILGDSNGAANLSLGSGTISFGAGNGNLSFNQSGGYVMSNQIASLSPGKGTITSSGSGTTTLTANNSGFTGSTYLSSGVVVLGNNTQLGGTLYVANKNAVFALNTGASLSGTNAIGVAGTLLDNSGLAFTNAVRSQVALASTGVLQKTYATNQSVAGFGAGIGAGKSFSILAGTAAANGTNTPTLQAKLVNGALDFKGTFTNAAVIAITDPSFSAIKNTIQWYNTNTGTWQNTIAGNTGNKTATISGMNGKSFAGSFDSFLLTAKTSGILDASHDTLAEINALPGLEINSTLAKIMGVFGYDSSTRTSWAVIDHNSIFDTGDGSVTPDLTPAALADAPAIADLSVFNSAPIDVQAVPEPGTWGLMLAGGVVLLLITRAKSRERF